MARSCGGNLVLHRYDFTFQLTDYITLFKEDYYAGKEICNDFIMSERST